MFYTCVINISKIADFCNFFLALSAICRAANRGVPRDALHPLSKNRGTKSVNSWTLIKSTANQHLNWIQYSKMGPFTILYFFPVLSIFIPKHSIIYIILRIELFIHMIYIKKCHLDLFFFCILFFYNN